MITLKKVYNEFKSYVSKHRNLETNRVDEIAEGRVWSGLSAKENGLIDEVGGHQTTISLLKESIAEKYPQILLSTDIGLEFKSLHSQKSSILQFLGVVGDSSKPSDSFL